MCHRRPDGGSAPCPAYVLATRLLQDKSYIPYGSFKRHNDAEGDRFGYFGGTLATAKTIPTRLILRRRTLQLPLATSPRWPDSKTKPSLAQLSGLLADVIVIFELSSPGVSGHPSTAHGGVLASCFDETMHKAVTAHLLETRQVGKPYTAQLDIRYHRPVRVPGLLIIRAKVVARTGRKFWVRAVASRQLDHGEETLTTDAVALFLQLGDSTTCRL
ncbi:hypothetical protein CNMCM8694_006640 [Aspergillus lentulus]|nr:hypothetical protein CNMCM8060_007050 [Aspergillus lentulus]KAF4176279.1 hypothetical protein CNMCM7927_004211 [Aspergillus lentulus]KAF4195209.1 hypothetical protein CNMCM8694_006640 [Aspergillus lentulus]